MKDTAIFKFNSRRGALLCSNCRVIIKTGEEFTEEEMKAMRGEIEIDSQYCKECKQTRA
jgi:ferredoxin